MKTAMCPICGCRKICDRYAKEGASIPCRELISLMDEWFRENVDEDEEEDDYTLEMESLGNNWY